MLRFMLREHGGQPAEENGGTHVRSITSVATAFTRLLVSFILTALIALYIYHLIFGDTDSAERINKIASAVALAVQHDASRQNTSNGQST